MINDDHWESFDGQNLGVGLREVLHREILKAINIKLQMGSNNIDLEMLIDADPQRSSEVFSNIGAIAN